MTDTPNARLLDCGFCYEEQGEEVHPHPECPIGRTGTPARYRLRSDEEIEAVQWTGHNAEALRAFCGPGFDTIDPEDRAEDPDQDAQLLSDASHWVGLKPGDWVLKHVDHFTATSDEAFRAVWEPAAPPVDRAALRDRIAEALYAHDHPSHVVPLNGTGMGPAYRESAAAVLAVLPEPTDRAAVLRDAAQHLYTALFPAVYNDLGQKAAEGVNRAVSELRRLAGDTPATESVPCMRREPHPAHQHSGLRKGVAVHGRCPGGEAVEARQDRAQQ